MATYVNNLRLKEITTGDEDGTWGTSTNTNLELITDALGYGTKQFAADSNETFTIPDATADGTRALYLKFTSAVSLTGTRTATLGPNTVSKMWMIENATTGGQSITIKQGSGAEITIGTGEKAFVYTDGAGAGAAVFNANPTETGSGTVTSIDVSGGTTGLTTSGGPITSSGTITVAGTLAIANGGTGSTATDYCNLTTNVTGTLPIANGGTGSTGTQYCDLTANVTGVLPFANGGSGAVFPLIKSTGYSAVNRDYIVVTAGSITITLPLSPSTGDSVVVKDGTGAAATTSFTVGRNGSNIASSPTDLTFDKNFAEITMTYINGTIGWSV
jgi:hypothetical protein